MVVSCGSRSVDHLVEGADTQQVRSTTLGPRERRLPGICARRKRRSRRRDRSVSARVIIVTPPPTVTDSEASLCQPPVSEVSAGALRGASGVAGDRVVGLVVGSGSDLSEEPAVQDVEPVTLDFVSFLIVLPGLPITARVGERPRPGSGRSRWRVAA